MVEDLVIVKKADIIMLSFQSIFYARKQKRKQKRFYAD